MKCKHCGEEIADDSTFCEFCGKQVGNGKSGKNRRLMVIGGIVAAALVLIVGVVAYSSHVKKVEEENRRVEQERVEQEIKEQTEKFINIQLKMYDDCQRDIAKLTLETFMKDFERVVVELQRFEDFEKDTTRKSSHNTPIVLKKSFSPGLMKDFQARLDVISVSANKELERLNHEKYDKRANLYLETEATIRLIDSIKSDLANSKDKSAKDIRLLRDNY